MGQEREQGKERRRQYGEAENAFKTATQSLKQAEEAGENSCRDSSVAEARTKVAGQGSSGSRPGTEETGSPSTISSGSPPGNACQEAEKQQQGRDEIDDCRKLVNLARQRLQLAKVLGTIQSRKEIAGLENRLQAVTAPDEKTLNGLRANRRKVKVCGPIGGGGLDPGRDPAAAGDDAARPRWPGGSTAGPAGRGEAGLVSAAAGRHRP